MRSHRFVLAALLAVAFAGQAAFAGVTAYIPFDVDKDGAAPGGTMPWFFDNPVGSHSVDTSGGKFGGALVSGSGAANWCGNGDCSLSSFIGAEGTIEFWVSPNWNGTDHGGPGIGGTSSSQDFLHMGGSTAGSSTAGVNIGLFNNGWPNDGGQMFASVKDADGSKGFESDYWSGDADSKAGAIGSSKTWAAGSWHHIAFTWDSSAYTLYADGLRVKEQPMGSGIELPGDMWLGGRGSASASFDGKIDEFIIRDNVQYSGESFAIPTKVLPEPASAVLFLAGGLMLGLRRRK